MARNTAWKTATMTAIDLEKARKIEHEGQEV